MWTDYYLKFGNEAAWAGVWGALPHGWDEHGAVDRVGTLFRQDTGAVSMGYHVNVRLPDGVGLPEALAPYVIAPPALPKRVFMA